jgi:hypothetical protein
MGFKNLNTEDAETELTNVVETAISELNETDITDRKIELKKNLTADCQVKEQILDIKNTLVDLKKQDHDSGIEILKETHFIRKNLGQHNKFTYGVVLVTGVLLGMTDQKWLPYASWLYELGKEILTKGN